MLKTTLVLALFLLSLASFAQTLTPAEKNLLAKYDQDYAGDHKKVSTHYAWLLYRSNEGINTKADSVLNQAIALQDHDPESLAYGQWGWSVKNGEKSVDGNNALFQTHTMFCGLWNEQQKMSADTKSNFVSSCQQIVEAAKRRWDYEIFDIYRDLLAYSNPFVMCIQVFTLAADRFNSPRLKKLANGQWARWYNHVSFFGIDEFASTVYNNVIFNALLDVRDFIHDERMQREVSEVLDHIYLLQSAITHPVLKLPVSGISRDYREFTRPGDASSKLLQKNSALNYTPPRKAVEINEARKYPFEVTGKASQMPFIFKSYQLKDAAMGSMTGGLCFWQQIHCMVAVGKSENERAVAFLPGTYNPISGYTDQIGTTTLCVYNRLPNYWHLTQKRGGPEEINYRETFDDFGFGINNWKEKSNTPERIVLEAYGYELHLFPFSVRDDKLSPCRLELKHRTTTSLRYHPRPVIFDEYVFPVEPDWFGVHVILAKAGTKVEKPRIEFTNKDGIRTFKTDKGHQLRLFISEKGDTRQLYNVDPALIPLLRISE